MSVEYKYRKDDWFNRVREMTERFVREAYDRRKRAHGVCAEEGDKDVYRELDNMASMWRKVVNTPGL